MLLLMLLLLNGMRHDHSRWQNSVVFFVAGKEGPILGDNLGASRYTRRPIMAGGHLCIVVTQCCTYLSPDAVVFQY